VKELKVLLNLMTW